MSKGRFFLAVVLLSLGSTASLCAYVTSAAPIISEQIAILDNSAESAYPAENPWLNPETRNGLLAHNDPVNKSDPMGLDALWVTSELRRVVELGIQAAAQAQQLSRASGDGMERGKIGVADDRSGKLSIPSGVGKGEGVPFKGPQTIPNMPTAPKGTHQVVNSHNHTNGTPMSRQDKNGSNFSGIPKVMTNDGKIFEVYKPLGPRSSSDGNSMRFNRNVEPVEDNGR